MPEAGLQGAGLPEAGLQGAVLPEAGLQGAGLQGALGAYRERCCDTARQWCWGSSSARRSFFLPLQSCSRGEDPVSIRGQAFFGRAAECIEEALSAAGARGYLTGSGLCVVPAEGLPVSMELSSADLLSDPVFVGDGQLLLRTRITGWPLGKGIRVKWKDGSQEGLVLERSVEADNLEGKWESEMLIEKAV